MTIYSFDEINLNTMFAKSMEGFVWHGQGLYLPIIGRTDVEELFTRWNYVRGDMRVSFVHPITGETVNWAIDKDSPIMAIARELGAAWNTGDNVRYLGTATTEGYAIHSPKEWIADAASDIIEATEYEGAEILTAVMLGAGAHCAISVSLKNVHTVADFDTRPMLSFVTGTKVPTTAVRGTVAMVCDNTIEMGLAEGIRVKHTKHSDGAIVDYRETIKTWVDSAQTTPEWIDRYANTYVDADRFAAMVDVWCPLPGGTASTTAEKRAEAMRKNVRDRLFAFWADDKEVRVSQWHGTALGAFQAFHTFEEHESRLRGNGDTNDEESLRASRHVMRRFFTSPVDNKGNDTTISTKVRRMIDNVCEMATV